MFERDAARLKKQRADENEDDLRADRGCRYFV